MSATGLDVFDKTLHITNTWLSEIMDDLGPDRQVAWHALGATLRALRDRLPTDLSANLGAQMPLLVRGLYYDQFRPSAQPTSQRTLDEFLATVSSGLGGIRPVNVQDATRAVFRVLNKHIDPGECRKVVEALPQPLQALWPDSAPGRRERAA